MHRTGVAIGLEDWNRSRSVWMNHQCDTRNAIPNGTISAVNKSVKACLRFPEAKLFLRAMTSLYTGSRAVIWWRTWGEAECLSRTGSSLLAIFGVLFGRFPIYFLNVHITRTITQQQRAPLLNFISLSNQQFTAFSVRPKFLSSLRKLETA